MQLAHNNQNMQPGMIQQIPIQGSMPQNMPQNMGVPQSHPGMIAGQNINPKFLGNMDQSQFWQWFDDQPSRQADETLAQSQFPTSKKNARSDLGGRSSELFVSYTISQDPTSEPANRSKKPAKENREPKHTIGREVGMGPRCTCISEVAEPRLKTNARAGLRVY
jgi:hypothetical protein